MGGNEERWAEDGCILDALRSFHTEDSALTCGDPHIQCTCSDLLLHPIFSTLLPPHSPTSCLLTISEHLAQALLLVGPQLRVRLQLGVQVGIHLQGREEGRSTKQSERGKLSDTNLSTSDLLLVRICRKMQKQDGNNAWQIRVPHFVRP